MPSPYDNAEQSREQATKALAEAKRLSTQTGPGFARHIELANAWAKVYAADVESGKRYT